MNSQNGHILLLAGTEQARLIANFIFNDLNYKNCTISFAGATQFTRSLSLDPVFYSQNNINIGGFGGIQGLENFLKSYKTKLIIDATHPFAQQIKNHATEASKKLKIQLVRFEREAWTKQKDDQWLECHSIEEAINLVRNQPETHIFLTIGKRFISDFNTISNKSFLVRTIDPYCQFIKFKNCTFITGFPPFALIAEKELMSQYKIETLVTKNSGGQASYNKIIAARELGIKVIMISQPKVIPNNTCFLSVLEIISWLKKNFFKI
ncbi:MAG: precorrin-6A reductase [Alphaproteobacteria bacterium]|nr:precorrin-6A reductase [Alphaproteobacteria bacterium]